MIESLLLFVSALPELPKALLIVTATSIVALTLYWLGQVALGLVFWLTFRCYTAWRIRGYRYRPGSVTGARRKSS